MAKGITNYLNKGKANAMTAGQLASLTGCSKRDIAAAIQAARLNGEPICSTNGEYKGFFLGDNQEVYDCCRALHARILTQEKTVQALSKIYLESARSETK